MRRANAIICTKRVSGTTVHFNTAIPIESAVNGVTINISAPAAKRWRDCQYQTVAILVMVNSVNKYIIDQLPKLYGYMAYLNGVCTGNKRYIPFFVLHLIAHTSA